MSNTQDFVDQSKDEIVPLLKQHVCTVKFIKKNGTTREMTCTLHDNFLPERDPAKEQTVARVDGPDLVTVYDIEAEGWRRFKLDSLVEPVTPIPDELWKPH